MGQNFQMISLENSLLTAQGFEVRSLWTGVHSAACFSVCFWCEKGDLSQGKETEDENPLNC